MQTCLLYMEIIHNVTESKNISVTFKKPGFFSEEKNKLDQKSVLKIAVSLLIFSDENNIAKLVGDMRGNCFDR